MKKIMFMCIWILGAATVSAQTVEKPDRFFLNAGVGVTPSFASPYLNVPVFLGVDYMLLPFLSVSGEYTFVSDEKHFSRTTRYGYKLGINYHFNKLLRLSPKWDLYAGAVTEYEMIYYSRDVYVDKPYNRPVYGFQVGARYFITDRMAINAKLGSGNVGSTGTLGISVKF
jgi:outer membrane immunogenic protein